MAFEYTKTDRKTGAVIRCVEVTDENGVTYIQEEVLVEGNTAPTQLDRVEAQATYTAMMTDTLLGG